MSERKLHRAAEPAHQVERHQIAKAERCGPSLQIFTACHRAAFELSLTQPLRLQKALVVGLIMLGQQGEMTADDDGSYLRPAFDGINGCRPRLGSFPGRNGHERNWVALPACGPPERRR